MTTPRQIVLGPSYDDQIGIRGELLEERRRRRVDQIDVARLERTHGAGWLRHQLDLDRVEVRASAVPAVEGGELQATADLDTLRHDHEGSGADRRDAELLVAHLLDHLLWHRGQRAAGTAGAGDGEERRERRAQRDGHRLLVRGLEGVDQGQLVGVWRGEVRVDGALVGVQQVCRGQRVAVVEGQAGPQSEGVLRAIL